MLEEQLRYDNDNDIVSRLVGTIIRYKNNPFLVQGVQPEYPLHIFGRDISTNKVIESIHTSDVELDISSPPLGYVNTRSECAFVSRSPARRWKQGVDPGALDYFWPASEKETSGASSHKFQVNHEGISDTIRGIYPSFDHNLIRDLQDGVYMSRAVGRKLAFKRSRDVKHLLIYHMSNNIGLFSIEDSSVFLFPKYDTMHYRNVLAKYNVGML